MSQEPIAEPSPAQNKPSFRGSSNYYVLIFGTFMLFGLLALAFIGRPPRSVMEGQSLPRIDLQPLVHASDPLTNEELVGKMSVLHFWGTWCPPCRSEFPEFAKLADKFSSNDRVRIISVSCSGGPEYDLQKLGTQTEAFLADFGGPIPTYSDSTALTRQQLAMLTSRGTFVYPTTLLVDGDGIILQTLEGYFPGEMEKLATKIGSQLASLSGK